MRAGFIDCKTCYHIKESQKIVNSVINRITGKPEIAVSYSCGWLGLPCPMLVTNCRDYSPKKEDWNRRVTDEKA